MKGIIFQLLEQVVDEEYGEDTWETVLDRTGLDGAYTSLASYPDEDFSRLVDAASFALHESPQSIVRWFGRKAFPRLAAKYPHFMTPHRTTIPFLLTLNDIIHPEVRKIYPDADVPEFDFVTPDDRTLVIGYTSQRRLCALAEGFIEGAAAHYGDLVTIRQEACMNQGDPRCVIRCEIERG
jgi:hypothetical protein